MVDQAVLSFGVSGKLWREVLVLYDRQTKSLWSQREHRAIAGPLDGSGLEVLESEVTDWASWRAAYPSTTVVVQPRDGGVLDPSELLIAGVLSLLAAGGLLSYRRWRRSSDVA